jgi:ABC-type antimicrobial peptide transport system permease subunit
MSQTAILRALFSAVGGLAGIALGWAISFSIASFTGWSTSVSIESVVVSFGFSALIGIIFGIYPARKASMLHPIDALRYE